MAGPIPVISVVGRSDSGKTTLLEQLIPELKRRGYSVAVIKHSYRGGVEFDVPGKDSYRLAQAGADQVLLGTRDKVVHIRRCEQEPTLNELVADIRDVDLILVEGHKAANVPKIEVNRREIGTELITQEEDLIAIVSDQRFNLSVPQFEPADTVGLADLVERFVRAARSWDSP